MHAADVVRIKCLGCGAQEYYPRALEVVNIQDLHKCRGTVNAAFTAPMEPAVAA
jgi:hypothetical protein